MRFVYYSHESWPPVHNCCICHLIISVNTSVPVEVFTVTATYLQCILLETTDFMLINSEKKEQDG